MSLFDEPELLAKLLTSIKTKNTEYTRELLPWSCTLLIKRLIDEKGKKAAVSSLPIGEYMVDDFLLLEKIPDDRKRTVIWDETGGIGVVFSSALKIARLKEDDDKRKLMGAVIQHGFIKTETDNIVVLKNKKPDMTVEECIETIVKFRPIIIQAYMVVLSTKDLENSLEELSKAQNKRSNDIIMEAFEKNLGLPIDAVSIEGDNTAISMNEDAYKKYEQVISERKLADIDIIPNFLVVD